MGCTERLFLRGRKNCKEEKMQVDYLENEPYPIGSLEQDFLGGIAALVKELLTRTDLHEEKQDRLSYWQLIFAQSKVKVASVVGRMIYRKAIGSDPRAPGFRND